MNWPRVNRQRRCAICGKSDWCTFNERGSGCMRVESPIQMKNGGWWHPNGDATRYDYWLRHKSSAQPSVATIDCDALLDSWRTHQNGQLEPFAATLGVSQDALRSLGCVWSSEHRAFAFPMVDANRRVIGIRLRNERGEKWAVKGSRSGLFMNLSGDQLRKRGGACATPVGEPNETSAAIAILHRGDCDSNGPATLQTLNSHTAQNNLPAVPVLAEPSAAAGHNGEAREVTGSPPNANPDGTRGGRQILLIVEGPTDTAAAIDLGLSVIGRPACLGCEDMIASVVAQHSHVATLILADADEPGQRGAVKLQEKLRKAKIVTLPAKDLRSAVQQGLTREGLQCILDSQI